MSTIKAIRERLGLTQAALGEGIGCTQANIGHYEKGQTVPPDAAKQLIGFARKHGMELSMDQVYGLAPLPENRAAAGAAPHLKRDRHDTHNPHDKPTSS